MDKIKNILSTIFNKKMVAVYIAVVILFSAVYQVITTIAVCNMIFPKGELQVSFAGDNIIVGDLASAEGASWFGTSYHREYAEGEDGQSLGACVVNNTDFSHSYIIMCYPSICTATDMADYAYHFYDIGFNVIIPDMNGCSESKNESITFGVGETNKILSWVEYIVNKDPDSYIFLFGLGSGGSAVLSACDEKLPDNVKGVIGDSSYNRLKDVFKDNAEPLYNKKAFPAVMIAQWVVKAEYGWSINDVCVQEDVHNAKVPVLFIHGSEDSVVSVSHGNDMYEVCPAVGSKHLLIDGATYCKAMQENPEKYWRTIDEFVIGHIN